MTFEQLLLMGAVFALMVCAFIYFMVNREKYLRCENTNKIRIGEKILSQDEKVLAQIEKEIDSGVYDDL